MEGLVEYSSAGSTIRPVPSPSTLQLGFSVQVGESLVVALTVQRDEVGVEIQDTAGNTWTELISGISPYDTWLSIRLYYSNIKYPISIGDEITFSFQESPQVCVALAAHFSDYLTPISGRVGSSGEGSSPSLLAGPTPAPEEEVLVFGAFSLRNPGREYTPGTEFTGFPKVVSEADTSNRALLAEYRYSSGSTEYIADGTLNTGGQWVGVVQTFSLSPSQEGTGRVKVWDGTQWVLRRVKVWDGTRWVTRPLRVRQGGDWVE